MENKTVRVYMCNKCAYVKLTYNMLIAGITCECCKTGNFDFIGKS